MSEGIGESEIEELVLYQNKVDEAINGVDCCWGRLLSERPWSSLLLLGRPGVVFRFDQEHVQDRCWFGAEELDVLGRPSQAWL